jgi:broad specificity phosphatase PhoE
LFSLFAALDAAMAGPRPEIALDGGPRRSYIGNRAPKGKLCGANSGLRDFLSDLSKPGFAMILIRHGQSEFNVVYNATRVDPGIPDPKLTAEGRRQAKAAAAILARHPVERLVASPYTRALETAEIIADALGLAIEVQPLVREHCLFHCDIGSPRSALCRRWPDLDFAHIDERWWPNLDESEATLAERCRSFREVMMASADWERVAVVTHWGFIRVLTGQQVPNAHLLRFDPHSGRTTDLVPIAVP